MDARRDDFYGAQKPTHQSDIYDGQAQAGRRMPEPALAGHHFRQDNVWGV